MPVVINEFEVMPADPPRQPEGRAHHEGAPSPRQMSEHEIEKLLERQRERFERVRAN